MPPPSVSITYPMPGAVLTPTFNVCGTFERQSFVPPSEDRNRQLWTAPDIKVYLRRGGNSYGPYTGVECSSGGGKWSALVGAPAGDDYTVSAVLTDGADTAQNDIETVDITPNPIIVLPVFCCPNLEVEDEIETARELAPLTPGAVRVLRTLNGKYYPADADEMFGVPYTITPELTVSDLSTGGKNYRVRYGYGKPELGGKFGEPLDKPNKKWKLKDIEVSYMQYVMVFLKRGGVTIGRNASPLF